jgi:hypothetical protein
MCCQYELHVVVVVVADDSLRAKTLLRRAEAFMRKSMPDKAQLVSIAKQDGVSSVIRWVAVLMRILFFETKWMSLLSTFILCYVEATPMGLALLYCLQQSST